MYFLLSLYDYVPIEATEMTEVVDYLWIFTT